MSPSWLVISGNLKNFWGHICWFNGIFWWVFCQVQPYNISINIIRNYSIILGLKSIFRCVKFLSLWIFCLNENPAKLVRFLTQFSCSLFKFAYNVCLLLWIWLSYPIDQENDPFPTQLTMLCNDKSFTIFQSFVSLHLWDVIRQLWILQISKLLVKYWIMHILHMWIINQFVNLKLHPDILIICFIERYAVQRTGIPVWDIEWQPILRVYLCIGIG